MPTPSRFTIPTIPLVAVRLLELYDDPDIELKDVVEMLQTDPALTAKIIKAANSSAYGVGREVTGLKQAVALLGKAMVTPLVLSFSLAEKSMPSQAAADLFRQYWLQAIVQAVTAECLAKRSAKSQAGEWFVVGLLSSIGRLALINHDADRYAKVVAEADTQEISFHQAERVLLETTTVDLSVELLREWNLPQRWIDAAANQIRIVEQLHELSEASSAHPPLMLAVATASAVGTYFCGNSQGESLIRIVALLEEGFGASEDEVDSLLESVRARVDAVSHLFQVSSEELGSSLELTSQAMQHLARLAVQQAMEQQREGAAESVEEQRHLLERIDRLMRRAATDTLTGVYNRGHFDERFAEQVAAATAAAGAIGLVFIDVDHFKSINDTYGHNAGDEVLRQIAKVLKSSVHSDDVLARYGGEEFVVIVSDPSQQDLEALGERLRTKVAQTPVTHAGVTLSITVSVGAALGRQRTLTEGFGERLITAADQAMYQAKRSGRNRVVISEPFTGAE